MTRETRYRLHPARSFSRAIHALLVVCALVAPSALWAQVPNCNPGETVTQDVDFTKKRFDGSDHIGPYFELQGWFEFDPIPDVAQYRLDITEFSINTSPPTLGRRFFYNTTNPPTRVDVYDLHRTSSGTLGVIVIHASGRPPSNAPAFWAGINGKAKLTYTCPTPKIDIEVLATSTLTGSGDNLKATFTATLTNKGTKTAENVELTVKLLEQDGPSGSAFGASSASVWLHVLSADSRCDQQLGFLTGKVVCRGLSIAGGDVKFLEFVTRVVNASDLKDRVTMTAVAPGDIDNSNNEDKTKVTPNLVGTMADTLEAMEALAPYFDYRATPGTGGSCDRFMNDIFNRLEAIRAENPSVFANLSYGRITSGAYNWAPIDNELTRAGHVGVVVYLKGSDYHETGIVIHGTPTWSPVDRDEESRRGTSAPGAHVTTTFERELARYTTPTGIPPRDMHMGTAWHGDYYRTPVSNFPGSPKPEVPEGCGFEGVYTDNANEFRGQTPRCGTRTAAAQSCPVMPEAVIVRTESPVDIQISNNRAQRVETKNGIIVSQQLGTGIYSFPTRHEDGTFGWLLVLPKDDYDIKLVGTGQGSYKLTTATFNERGQADTTVHEGTTQLGQMDDYKVAAPVPAVTVTAPPPSQTGNGKGGGGSTTPGLLASLLLLLLAQRRLRAANKTATSAI